MLGFLIYLPTLVYMPHFLFLLAFVWIMYRHPEMLSRSYFKSKWEDSGVGRSLLWIIFFIVLSLVNMLLHADSISSIRQAIPYTVLMIPTIFLAFALKKRDAVVILCFISLEVLVGIVEYTMGVSTFIKSHVMYMEFPSDALMYYSRVLGLSDNSSVLANKVFIGFLLLRLFPLQKYLRRVFIGVLLIGLLITFNRSVFVALLSFLFLLYFEPLWNNYRRKGAASRFSYLPGMVLGFSLLLAAFWDNLVSQFTRNRGTIELSGRDKIWAGFGEFIQDHFWFGNGSFKYSWEGFHAHNSFLQILSNHGIVLSILLVFIVLYNTRKSNLVVVLPMLLYSFSQYGVFWGISIMDIVFFYALFAYQLKSNKSIGRIDLIHPSHALSSG